MRPTFDDRDTATLAGRVAALDLDPYPREGDYVIFADGCTRRISHVGHWGERLGDDPLDGIQTSDDGSFYIGHGHVSFSGGLYPAVRPTTLTLTDERRNGPVWFFHHNVAGADNGVTASISFRVYRCSQKAPQ